MYYSGRFDECIILQWLKKATYPYKTYVVLGIRDLMIASY